MDKGQTVVQILPDMQQQGQLESAGARQTDKGQIAVKIFPLACAATMALLPLF